MIPGDVIGDRFEIESAVATGGSSRVYRARDRQHDGHVVALKVLFGLPEIVERFTQEVAILATVRHPAIVRYVAHGMEGGEPWLAMEWLEGPTLAARLEAGPLTVEESVHLLARLAGALGTFHRRGGVHRDVKPANVVLPRGELERATLIDFGVARLGGRPLELTQQGQLLGTPRYMAPEQIRHPEAVDARADVFSLGCVLFRCLTGRNAFLGNDLSILLKILVENPPPARELREGIPASLDELLARMLAKAPEARPPDGNAVAEALALPAEARPAAGPLTELGSDERRVMCLVLTVDRAREGGATRSVDEHAELQRALRETVAAHRGRIELLADRSLLAVLASTGTASDLAALAARCALGVAPLLGATPLAVVTGRAALAGNVPVGELIDRAVELLDAASRVRSGGICLDEVSAALLGSAFEVVKDEAGWLLRGELALDEEPRTLLGKALPCLGRELELRRLEDAFERCAAERTAHAVLITAPAGAGKSRLAHELVRRLRERAPRPEIWIGRGDPLSAGSPFGLLGQALRRAAGIAAGEPIEARRRKIEERVARHAGAGKTCVVELLGELCGAPFPDESSAQLRAARRDPVLMGDQMRRAFEDFLRAELEAHPVVLVLEDLHWGDGGTGRAVEAALRNLRDRPLFVLALARPEVYEVLPRLWVARGLDEVRLGPLPRRIGERLARETLGPAASDEAIRSLVQRSEGNAFYLEELIRAEAEGKGTSLPESVLSMVQGRLERLPPDARRILRAASVFGQTFRGAGVAALLGGAESGGWLALLVDEEVVSEVRERRFAGDVEYVFRHALVREAAYGMLTEEDRSAGHRLAGAWLESAGEHEAIVLAEHFERGGERARAALSFARAAEQALEANDLELAVARVDRGIACAGEDGTVAAGWLGRTWLLRAQANRWRGQHREALGDALLAMARLPRGAAAWWEAVAEAAAASVNVPDPAQLAACSAALLVTELEDGAGGPPASAREDAAVAYVIALARTAITCFFAGHPADAERLLERSAAAAQRVVLDPAVEAHVASGRGIRALLKGEIGDYLELMQVARGWFEQAGDMRSACQQSIRIGDAHIHFGSYGAAREALGFAIAEAERMGLSGLRAAATTNLGMALALDGEIAAGMAAEERALALIREENDQRFELTARLYLARIRGMAGDAAGAAAEIEPMLADAEVPGAYRAYALALKASAKLAQGETAAAKGAASEAMALMRALGEIEEGETLIRAVHVEALAASGDVEAAAAAAMEAREQVLRHEARIQAPEMRRSFRERVPENARILALAAQLCEG